MRRTLIAVLSVIAAFALAASLAEAADPVYVRDPVTNRLAQHPRTVNFRDVDITGLRWIHWGKLRAIGRGKASVLICEPSCAAGHRERGSVRLVLRKRVLHRGASRKVPPWLERWFFPVTFAVLLAMLVFRLVATNGDGVWLSALLVGLAVAAAFTNAFWSGKTWCNFFCPVSVTERIYTDPGSLRRRGARRADGKHECGSTGRERKQEGGTRSRGERGHGFLPDE